MFALLSMLLKRYKVVSCNGLQSSQCKVSNTIVTMATDSGNSVELPSEFESGHLACYTPPGAIRPSRFQWLAGPGLYRGALNLAPNTHSTSELDLLADRSLLPLPLTSSMQENALAVVGNVTSDRIVCSLMRYSVALAVCCMCDHVVLEIWVWSFIA